MKRKVDEANAVRSLYSRKYRGDEVNEADKMDEKRSKKQMKQGTN